MGATGRHLTEGGQLEPLRRRRLEREFRRILVARVEERGPDLEGTDRASPGSPVPLAERRLDPYEAADELLGSIAAFDEGSPSGDGA